MSKYTTEVRYICEFENGLTESKGYSSVNEIIVNAIPKIFNFDFPIFDEAYRVILEKKILKHFYTREIGEETVGLWKLRLDAKLNEIMPYYNKMYTSELLEFNPLYTTDLTRTRQGTVDNKNSGEVTSTSQSASSNQSANTNETTGSNQNSSNGQGSGSNSGSTVDKFSETPQGALTNVENGTYLTNARITNDSATSSSTSSNSSTGSYTINGTGSVNSSASANASGTVESDGSSLTTEDYLEHVVGYENKNASKTIKEYRETFLNIDMMIINELESLFMQLW